MTNAMVTELQLQQFNENGYFILDNFFTPEEMNNLTTKIDFYVDEHNRELQHTNNHNGGISRANEIIFTTNLIKKDDLFQQFCSQDKFVDLTTRILGPDVSLFWDQSVYKRPETHKDFPWHQDNGYGLVLSEEYVTCWIALEDATIENGCIWVMPQTHLQGIVEHKSTPIGWQCYFGDDPGTPVPLKKGSMVVFSSLLFHRSGPNVSNHVRKGYIVQFFPSQAVNVKTGKPFRKMMIAKNGKAELDTTYIEEQDHNAV
jgi:phytanoyl-CoA hydroxylase